ncbi:MAG: alanine racemase [Bacteroidota bacterium]
MVRDTYAVIDLDAVEHNLTLIKNEIPLEKVYAVVKANAYGHGLTAFTRFLYGMGVRHFAVACLKEALELYSDAKEISADATILIMGYTSNRLLSEFREYPFVFTIFSLEQARILNGASRTVPVEIKVNTGFNRLGERPDERFLKEVTEIHNLNNILINGIFSHLRLAEKDEDLRQISDFERFCNTLPFSNFRRHICDSIGFIQYPFARFDMVRLGAILYGLVPDRQLHLGYRPTLSLYSEIAHRITVHKGEGIAYDEQFKAPSEMTIAVIPIGYGDGYKRSLSNQGSVYVIGRLCPVISTICMDQLTVDVTGLNLRTGDPVELIGPNIPVRNIAAIARTNRNDIVASLSTRIERRYTQGDTVVKIV